MVKLSCGYFITRQLNPEIDLFKGGFISIFVVLLIPIVLLDYNIFDVRLLEVYLSSDIEVGEDFVDIGNLIFSWEDSIMAIKLAGNKLIIISAVCLQILLVSIHK